jgi:nicotinate phosphoribosyltransferase
VSFVEAGVVNSDFVGVEATRRAREHHKLAKSELPLQGLRLMRGDAAIPTELI